MHTGAELASLLTHIPLTCQKKSVDDTSCLNTIKTALFESCAQLGFEYVRFSCWTRFTTDEGNVRYWYSINFSNFPHKWEQDYDSAQLYLTDPVVRIIQSKPENVPVAYGSWASALSFAHAHPLGDSAAEKKDYCAKTSQLFEAAMAAGLQQGHYFTCQDSMRHVAISLSTAGNKTLSPEKVDALYKTLFAMAHLLHQSIALTRQCELCAKFVRTDGQSELQISTAQRNVLLHFLQQPSASTKEIALQLGITPDTVNYHLKNLRQQLGKHGASGFVLAQFARELNLI